MGLPLKRGTLVLGPGFVKHHFNRDTAELSSASQITELGEHVSLHVQQRLASMQEHAPEDACAKHGGSVERLTRETSADVESDLSPTWEAASVPDALAPGSRKSDGSASGEGQDLTGQARTCFHDDQDMTAGTMDSEGNQACSALVI